MIDDEAEEMFHRIQNSDLLYKPSLKECQRIVETSEINDILLLSISSWGEVRGLLCGYEDNLPTHRGTKETLVLLGKIQEFWKLVKKSLVPRERHLRLIN